MEFLRGKATVDAVIGMPESLFKTSGKGGTHTKTCLLVFTKAGTPRIRVARSSWPRRNGAARTPATNSRTTTFQPLGCISGLSKGKKLHPSRFGFIIEDNNPRRTSFVHVTMILNSMPRLPPFKRRMSWLGSAIWLGRQCLAVSTGDEVGKLAYGGGDVPFVRTSDLSNWEIKLDPKHTLERVLYATLKDKQDVRPGDILMVKDGTYRNRDCEMVTSTTANGVSEPHLQDSGSEGSPLNLPLYPRRWPSSAPRSYNVRSRPSSYGRHHRQSRRADQRIGLPFPRSEEAQKRITKMVSRVIEERVEAGELADVRQSPFLTVTCVSEALRAAI